MTTYRLTDHSCNDKWIVGASEEMGPAKGIAGSHLSVAPEKLVSPHKQISICEAVINQGLTSGERAYQRVVYNILFKGNINATIRGI